MREYNEANGKDVRRRGAVFERARERRSGAGGTLSGL